MIVVELADAHRLDAAVVLEAGVALAHIHVGRVAKACSGARLQAAEGGVDEGAVAGAS